ncbi:hypothetical protein [Sorangium sp. So ce131]|uniref:hypothetical protein n=1 Tax=Sorangium sp. So ce131 TaxID=3133282 RepID=UPI003F6408C7
MLATALMSAARPAYADVTFVGSVSPADPSPSDTLVVGAGIEQVGQVLVTNRGRLVSAGARVGYDQGTGTVEVIGYGSSWINNGPLELALGAGSSGALVVRRGARVTTDDLVVGARGYVAEGRVLVEGYDATLTSRTNARIGRSEALSALEVRQGASFFSNHVYIGDCPVCGGSATAAGAHTRWISTGDFVVGVRGALVVRDGAELTTVGAALGSPRGDWLDPVAQVSVSGWGAAWTNQGLLRVGAGSFAGLSVGAYGALVTDEVVIRSELGASFVQVNAPYASWINRGDVAVLASLSSSPSLLVDRGGLVHIGGLLRTAPLVEGGSSPYLGPSVRLVRGDLIAGAIEVDEGDLDFAGGRLSTGSFAGDLVNTQRGALLVGGSHPATAVAGSYRQGPDAALRIAVAGPGAAPLLDVDGDVDLDGALEVRAADGATPFQEGDTVALLGWSGELSGAFAAVEITLPIAPGLAWDTSALYTTGEITAVAAP